MRVAFALELSWWTLVVCSGVTHADELAEDRAAALTSIRQAASARDMAGLKTSLAAAAKLKGEDRFDADLARLDELGEYVAKFWQAVERGCRVAGERQRIGSRRPARGRRRICQWAIGPSRRGPEQGLHAEGHAAQARVDAGGARAQGQRRAEQGLLRRVLALDAKGDRKLARQHWDEAAAAGIDVKRLLPELEVPLPAPPVEIPVMNPVLRNLLSDKNWSLRQKTEKGWVRDALDKVGKQNDEGRLEVSIPADPPAARQLVARRQISGDFVCRMIVIHQDKSNTVGLFAAGLEDEGYTAPIPKGTSLLELSRQQGQLACKINGTEVKLTPTGKPAARLSGYIGLQLAPGSQVTVAAVEFAAR